MKGVATFSLMAALTSGVTGCSNSAFKGSSGTDRHQDDNDPDGQNNADETCAEEEGQEACETDATDTGSPGGDLEATGDKAIDDVIKTSDGTVVHIRKQCKLVIAWTNSRGPQYFKDFNALPKSVTVTRLNLYEKELQASDLDNADIFAMVDAGVNLAKEGATWKEKGYRLLTAGEKKILRSRHRAGLNFVLAGDNSESTDPQGDANKGSRDVLAAITDLLVLKPTFHYPEDGVDESGERFADAKKFPFLKGVRFLFGGSSLRTPGHLTKVSSPARCVIENDGKCRVGYLPDQGGQGFIFVHGNAGLGSNLYMARLMEKQCQ